MVLLAQTAGSSRVLNLILLNEKIHDQDETAATKPFFKAEILNNAIVLKSRLRGGERDLFESPPSTATKLLLPYDTTNLRVGGKSMFVGESEFSNIMRDHIGVDMNSMNDKNRSDLNILDLLDELPSLDPFLLKERMAMAEMSVDSRYFNITPHDWQKIRGFVMEEFSPLAMMTVGDSGTKQFAEMLTTKLWEGRDMSTLGPLLDALKLDKTNAADTLFAWKGILYYKYMFETLRDRLLGMLNKMNALRIINYRDFEHKREVLALREEVTSELKICLAQVGQSLKIYETKYHTEFLVEKNPIAFRDFLQSAPTMFTSLGPNIAAVDHSVTYWNFRFAREGINVAEASDVEDVLVNFLSGL